MKAAQPGWEQQAALQEEALGEGKEARSVPSKLVPGSRLLLQEGAWALAEWASSRRPAVVRSELMLLVPAASLLEATCSGRR